MAVIYETLYTEPSDVLAPAFTVNTAVNEVPLVFAGPFRFSQINGRPYFGVGDNVILKTVTVRLPYSFGQGTGINVFTMKWQDRAAVLNIIPELSGNGSIIMPSGPCGEHNLNTPDGLFLKNAFTLGQQFVLDDISLNVSMLGVPASLNGLVLKAQVFLQLTHTLPMLAP